MEDQLSAEKRPSRRGYFKTIYYILTDVYQPIIGDAAAVLYNTLDRLVWGRKVISRRAIGGYLKGWADGKFAKHMKILESVGLVSRYFTEKGKAPTFVVKNLREENDAYIAFRELHRSAFGDNDPVPTIVQPLRACVQACFDDPSTGLKDGWISSCLVETAAKIAGGSCENRRGVLRKSQGGPAKIAEILRVSSQEFGSEESSCEGEAPPASGASRPHEDVGRMTPINPAASGEEDLKPRRAGRQRLPSEASYGEIEKPLSPEAVEALRFLWKAAEDQGGYLGAPYAKFLRGLLARHNPRTIEAGVLAMRVKVESGEVASFKHWTIGGFIKNVGKPWGSSGSGWRPLTDEEKMPSLKGITVEETDTLVVDSNYAEAEQEEFHHYYKCRGCGFDRVLFDNKECQGCGKEVIERVLRGTHEQVPA